MTGPNDNPTDNPAWDAFPVPPETQEEAEVDSVNDTPCSKCGFIHINQVRCPTQDDLDALETFNTEFDVMQKQRIKQ